MPDIDRASLFPEAFGVTSLSPWPLSTGQGTILAESRALFLHKGPLTTQCTRYNAQHTSIVVESRETRWSRFDGPAVVVVPYIEHIRSPRATPIPKSCPLRRLVGTAKRTTWLGCIFCFVGWNDRSPSTLLNTPDHCCLASLSPNKKGGVK